MSQIAIKYKDEIIPKLQESCGYSNVFQVPKIVKMVISSGIGTGKDRDVFDEAIRTVADITGQRPYITKSRVNVAGFKLRKGSNVGVAVTLRGKRMYDFFTRLVNIALPRVRDFRGVSPKSFDGRGNFSMGITDQSIFTDVNLDKMKHTIGMNINIITTADTNEEGFQLLSMMGIPFRK